jgi:hypothetical protein
MIARNMKLNPQIASSYYPDGGITLLRVKSVRVD